MKILTHWEVVQKDELGAIIFIYASTTMDYVCQCTDLRIEPQGKRSIGAHCMNGGLMETMARGFSEMLIIHPRQSNSYQPVPASSSVEAR